MQKWAVFYLISKHSLNFNVLSLRKQSTFGDTTTGFPAKWRLRNKCRNSTLITHHYPDLCCASDWLNQISYISRPIGSTTKIWVVTLHQYGISAFISQMSFGGETSGSVTKCRLFSQAIISFFIFIIIVAFILESFRMQLLHSQWCLELKQGN